MNSQKELARIAKLPPTIQQIELAAYLASLFENLGVRLTVVGGATVQYYTNAEYVTSDLDVILQGDTKEIIEQVMAELKFKRTTNYRHFEHPSLPFVVEFPPSPIQIGSRIISKANLLKLSELSVRIIRVEDIIMDRIIAAVEWKDRPSLEQAKLMWIKNKKHIDLNYLTDFATQEGYLKTLNEVLS